MYLFINQSTFDRPKVLYKYKQLYKTNLMARLLKITVDLNNNNKK